MRSMYMFPELLSGYGYLTFEGGGNFDLCGFGLCCRTDCRFPAEEPSELEFCDTTGNKLLPLIWSRLAFAAMFWPCWVNVDTKASTAAVDVMSLDREQGSWEDKADDCRWLVKAVVVSGLLLKVDRLVSWLEYCARFPEPICSTGNK